MASGVGWITYLLTVSGGRLKYEEAYFKAYDDVAQAMRGIVWHSTIRNVDMLAWVESYPIRYIMISSRATDGSMKHASRILFTNADSACHGLGRFLFERKASRSHKRLIKCNHLSHQTIHTASMTVEKSSFVSPRVLSVKTNGISVNFGC